MILPHSPTTGQLTPVRHPGGVSLPVLTSERLTLRAWDPDDPRDVATAFDIYSRDAVARWLGPHPAPWADENAARERLLRWQSGGREDQPGFGVWAIVPHGSATPVGSGLLVHLPDAEGTPTDDVEIGWHLHPDAWGNGYATETGRRLLQHARETLGVHVINSVAYAGNDASLAVMRRLGLQPHGETDRWYGVHLQWWSTSA